MTYTLVVMRHGESAWNAENRFAGWVDVALTEKGEGEAKRAGELLVTAGIQPEVVHTSLLRRAIRTAQIVLAAADREWVPVQRSWRLNERHYGALQGKDKAAIREEFGDEPFMTWRRSFDAPRRHLTMTPNSPTSTTPAMPACRARQGRGPRA